MRRCTHALSLLALLGLALAGCSTTPGGDDYSSLPTTPHRPHRADAAAQPADPALPLPGYDTGSQVPPEQPGDLLDRIRAGYGIPQVQHYAVEREVELYRSRPDSLDRTFRRGTRYLHHIVTEVERRGLPTSDCLDRL